MAGTAPTIAPTGGLYGPSLGSMTRAVTKAATPDNSRVDTMAK